MKIRNQIILSVSLISLSFLLALGALLFYRVVVVVNVGEAMKPIIEGAAENRKALDDFVKTQPNDLELAGFQVELIRKVLSQISTGKKLMSRLPPDPVWGTNLSREYWNIFDKNIRTKISLIEPQLKLLETIHEKLKMNSKDYEADLTLLRENEAAILKAKEAETQTSREIVQKLRAHWPYRYFF